jgi:hypothetical protein
MVLNHIAAIFLFSGPLFYIGLLAAVDPAGIAALLELLARALRTLRCALGLPAQKADGPGQPHGSRQIRKIVRLAGLALLFCGLFGAVV